MEPSSGTSSTVSELRLKLRGVLCELRSPSASGTVMGVASWLALPRVTARWRSMACSSRTVSLSLSEPSPAGMGTSLEWG